MFFKRAAVLSVTLLLVFSLTGCVLNSSARPVSDFDTINDFVAHYGKETFTGDTEESGLFVKNLAGLVEKLDNKSTFSDWTATPAENNDGTVYEKQVQMYGYDWTLTISIPTNKKWISAISLVYEGDDAFRLASAFALGTYDRMGSAYSALLDGENSYDTPMKTYLSEGDGSRSFAVIWPKSSVKWSGMVQYDPSGAKPIMAIKIL